MFKNPATLQAAITVATNKILEKQEMLQYVTNAPECPL